MVIVHICLCKMATNVWRSTCPVFRTLELVNTSQTLLQLPKMT